jgi:UPF0176 protein
LPASHSSAPIRVAALYQFARFDDCPGIQARLKSACASGGVRGTLILAEEGINGTIAGPGDGVEAVLREIRTLPGCAGLVVKDSSAGEMPFHRMKVKIKDEIVTMGEPGISPLRGGGEYVAPAEWNALISDPRTIVIDTRNRYEVALGSFGKAVDPGTSRFRDFPAWFRDERDLLTGGEPAKVAMFCTGGIRCEKATALLRAEGVEEVYHLQGGILAYLEQVPAEQSLWEGECFVFDSRVSVIHGLAPGSHEICHACGLPVAPEARDSPGYEEGVSCPACYALRGSEQRQRYAERQRQERLAQARGHRHVGQGGADG